MTTLKEALETIADHRFASGRMYRYSSLVLLVILGFMCGCNSLASVIRMAKTLTRKQREALGFLWWQLPSHPTLCIFFHGLDVAALQAALSASTSGKTVAIDGKRLRGSLSKDMPEGVHLLSCFASACRQVLGQARPKKGGNEITAALELLQSLELKDTVITGDAIFAQRAICQTIRDKGGHYVFALKDNHKSMKDAAEQDFSPRRKRSRPVRGNTSIARTRRDPTH